MDEELEEVRIYGFQNDTKKVKELLNKNRKLVAKLIKFCIRHFDDYKPRIELH